MLQALVSTANQLLGDLNRAFLYPRGPTHLRPTTAAPAVAGCQPLRRVVLTDGVAHTLFEEYAAHRAEARGEEETGWVLLGIRERADAVVLATLPAGAERDASVAHVRFNCVAQAVGSRIVRQADRRLTILGVVHTHPGSLRHPSDADLRGDGPWVKNLRGGEGIFGIGTADAPPSTDPHFGYRPKPHVQCVGNLRLSWYSLRFGENGYRPLPLELTIGPDLARPLHPIWSVIEAHAERLDRLARQQVGLTFEPVEAEDGPALAVTVPVAEPGEAVRVLLTDRKVFYFVARDGQTLAVQQTEDRVDRGVYLVLAELAAKAW